MYGRPGISQEWSLHAQLTVSHCPPVGAAPPPQHDSSGVRMQYMWGGEPVSPPPSSSNIPPRTCYGFQRGNILFTTRPPPREPQSAPTATHRVGATHLLDSGYSSEQVSPGSYASLPTRRPSQPYNRRCKSTCSIVLSGTEHQGVASASMRPNTEYSSACKCGDPTCVHQHRSSPLPGYKEVRPRSPNFSPLPEICEVCGGGKSPTAIRRGSAANTFTAHFCTHVPERVLRDVDKRSQDVASQTSDHISATAPDLGVTSVCQNKPIQPKMGNKVVYGGVRRKTDSELLQLPVINVVEPNITHMKPTSRLTRSPARLCGQSPLLSGGPGRKSQGSQCTLSQPKDKGQHKPRTVHIDVYCTGSEDADASSSSDDSDSFSSPQTVFESDKLKVVHTHIDKDKLPAGYPSRQHLERQDKVARVVSRRSESFKYEMTRTAEEQQVARGYDSDDGLSSHYPSQISSYSTLRGATDTSVPQSEVTSSASRNPSSSTISSSSMALSDEYDSAAATSWKDTVTDLDSLVQSSLSLAQSDSFEYADVADRLRIREKEKAWADDGGDGDGSKTWRSPHVERKHLLQQQKFKEFLEKRLGKMALPVWKAEVTEDSDDDDETGDAWSFCGPQTHLSPQSAGKALKREDTVKRVPSGRGKGEMRSVTPAKGAVTAKASCLPKPSALDLGSLSDSGPHRFMCRTSIGPFGERMPTPPPSKVTTSVTSPFTDIPGKRTDQLSKAEKFGTIIGTFRKPGHHVGPSKNPDCACEHCRKYYEDSGYRTRTRSVGDMPLDSVNYNWKNMQPRDAQGNINVTGKDSDMESSSITEDACTDNENYENNTSLV